MTAPVITFWTGSSTTGDSAPNGAFNMAALGQMATVFDYGTIDTGSSGSNTWFWIWNNIAAASDIADAILSSSGQVPGNASQLGLGHHESGSAGHNSESSYTWSLQSGSLTGSVWVRSNYYLIGITGSLYSSGALASNWCYIYSGSSGTRLSTNGLVLSGSTTMGVSGSLGSGSAWMIGSYIYVLNGTSRGTKTGSFCVRYKYT